MRLFFAIGIPEELRMQIWRAAQSIKLANPKFKATWVKPENMHLSLLFIQNVIPGNLGPIRTCAMKIKDFKPFDIELGETGVFPLKGAPRVLWVGFKKGQDEIMKLQNELASQFRLANIPFDDKPFHPHLTIARIKSFMKPEIQPLSFEPFKASKFSLIESHLTTEGPEYRLEADFPLQ